MEENLDKIEEFEEPFGESFDKSDVIESISDIEKLAKEKSTSKEFSEKYKPRDKEIQKLGDDNQYDEINDAEFKVFSNDYQSSEFQDILELQKIPGVKSRMPSGCYFPKEIIDDRRQKILIQDNIADEHKRTTILTNYDSDGNITSIEVICKCGEKTIINFEFASDSENESIKQLSDKNIQATD